MESLKNVLKSNILSSSKPRLFGASLVVGMWEKTLVSVHGPKAWGKSQAISFRAGVLKVVVYHQVWLLDITLRQERLVSLINQKLGSSIVKSIQPVMISK